MCGAVPDRHHHGGSGQDKAPRKGEPHRRVESSPKRFRQVDLGFAHPPLRVGKEERTLERHSIVAGRAPSLGIPSGNAQIANSTPRELDGWPAQWTDGGA